MSREFTFELEKTTLVNQNARERYGSAQEFYVHLPDLVSTTSLV